MAKFRMGWSMGPGKGEEVPFAANQYLNRQNGRFVKMVNGRATLYTNATPTGTAGGIFGWAHAPKDDSGKNGHKTSAEEKGFVYVGVENKFWMPLDTASASANATVVGAGANIKTANATYALTQKAYKVGTEASQMLLIHDFDADNDAVLVSIKPSAFMS